MEALAILIPLLIVTPMVLAVWLVARALGARNSLNELTRRLGEVESEVLRLKQERGRAPRAETVAPSPVTPAPGPAEAPGLEPEGVLAAASEPWPALEPEGVPPMVAPPLVAALAPAPAWLPPPPDAEEEPPRAPAAPGKPTPAIDWERFMGVKLIAWIGGLAMFLGVAFFIKYAFDRNLIPPELRMALAFIAGLGLLAGGVGLSRKDYATLSQTLCATGVVILYAAAFACRSIYHFPFFGPIPTFLLMVLITAAAFLLAVRLNARIVALLGMLGGFLTPILLSTGQDNPLALFGYIAILDAGLLLVAMHRRWFFIAPLAAAATAVLQAAWADEFFTAGKYFDGDKILIPLAVLLGFTALYLAAAAWAKRRNCFGRWLADPTLGLAAVAFAFTAWFLTFAPLAQRPWLMFGFVFLVDLCVIGLGLLDDKITLAQPIAGLAVFGLLALWTAKSLTNGLLAAALTFYFLFAVVHSAFPVFLQRWRGVNVPHWRSQVFPPLALVLVLIPLFQLEEVSFLVWPFVLLVDLLAIGLAVATVSLLSVLAVLVLTLAATAALILKIPATLTGLPTSFFLLGAFAVFFVAAGVWLARKFKPQAFRAGFSFSDSLASPGDLAVQLAVVSAVLPFLLLVMATERLPLGDPSPVFGLALLLVVLLLGVTRLFALDWMPAVGLVCVSALECAWHFRWFDPARAERPLIWYLVFLAVFTLFPFLFLRRFSDKVVPWATAALVGPAQFFLLHRLLRAAYPNDLMGLLPAAFTLPPLLGLAVVLKRVPAASPARMTQLAWLGGVSLFFITLIFPIQFERQWITLGWALEGAALLWLFHRVPHPGLRLAGVGLLLLAFVRLAVNPAVLGYHPRSAAPILNWYFYAYGLVSLCLFAGARLLAPPRDRVLGISAPSILAGLGIGLAFLLVNIEIADYFSAPGSTLTFEFGGNFARDMTYSIAWALVALTLLVAGIARGVAPLRYSALGLLGVTVLKLFFHDLASLDQLYRIGAFVGVAVVAMLASFAYQRFFSAAAKRKDAKDEPA